MNIELDIKDVQYITRTILKNIDKICTTQDINYSLVCGSVLGAIRHKGPIPWDYDVDICVPYNQMKKFIDAMERKLPDPYYIATADNDPSYAVPFPRIGVKGINTRDLHVDIFPSIGISSNTENQIKFYKKINIIRKLYYYKRKTRNIDGKWSIRLIKLCMSIALMPISEKRLYRKLELMCSMYNYDEALYVTNPYGGYGTKNILDKEYFNNLIYVDYMDLKLPVPYNYDQYLKHYYKDYMKFPSLEEQNLGESFSINIPLEIYKILKLEGLGEINNE